MNDCEVYGRFATSTNRFDFQVGENTGGLCARRDMNTDHLYGFCKEYQVDNGTYLYKIHPSRKWVYAENRRRLAAHEVRLRETGDDFDSGGELGVDQFAPDYVYSVCLIDTRRGICLARSCSAPFKIIGNWKGKEKKR